MSVTLGVVVDHINVIFSVAAGVIPLGNIYRNKVTDGPVYCKKMKSSRTLVVRRFVLNYLNSVNSPTFVGPKY